MRELKIGLGIIAILFISFMVVSGCSKDEGPPDITINYAILVFPEGAGTVTTNLIKRDNGVYTAVLTAVPSAGYTFSHWLGSDCSFPDDKENPCRRDIFAYWQGPITIKASAVFEEME